MNRDQLQLRGLGGDGDAVFVVVVVLVGDGVVLCRRRDRSTWEVPGGQVEPGESPLAAACRELREEAGLVGTLTAVADYVYRGAMGRLFVTALHGAAPTPGHEMAAADIFRDLPALTYPDITPALLAVGRSGWDPRSEGYQPTA